MLLQKLFRGCDFTEDFLSSFDLFDFCFEQASSVSVETAGQKPLSIPHKLDGSGCFSELPVIWRGTLYQFFLLFLFFGPIKAFHRYSVNPLDKPVLFGYSNPT